jgi:hypothetical protein
MRTFALRRFALSVSLVALLAACGGPSMPIRATDNATTDASVLINSKTFDYTGKKQTFVVPSGVNQLTVIARGGQGSGELQPPRYDQPGFPGRVYAVIRVHPGDKLYVFVGGSGAHGGFNGGGAGGTAGYGSKKGNAGGGASDIRIGGDTLKDRIIVAAGGGGTGACFAYCFAWGGNGGGLTGRPGGTYGRSDSGVGGTGASQTSGGSGGAGGLGNESSGNGQTGGNGALGLGGDGGNGGPGLTYYAGGQPGGGGGGGYYGGGGGGGGGASKQYATEGGGGGGGSSYVEPNAIKPRMWTGWKAKGDGRVIFGWN